MEYRSKAKSQEERFASKRKELEKQLRDARSSLDKVTWAKDQAAGEAARLSEELSSLHGQIGPVTKIIEASQQAAAEAQTLQRERCKMFRTLAVRANVATARLGVGDLRIPSLLPSDDPVAFLQLFTQIVEKLETAATSLDNIVEEECRELLSFVGTRIFPNLLHGDPSFDFGAALQVVEPVIVPNLAEGVKVHVEALLMLYQRKKDGEASEASGDEASGEDLEGSASSE
jgi:hypothetical protein